MKLPRCLRTQLGLKIYWKLSKILKKWEIASLKRLRKDILIVSSEVSLQGGNQAVFDSGIPA